MLGRLQIRDKLNLLVVIPLVLAALLLVPLLSSRFIEAQVSARTASVADEARQLSALVEELQQARLLAVAHLRSPAVDSNSLMVQLQLVQEQRLRVARLARENADLPLVAALEAVDGLIRLTEPNLIARAASPQATIIAYGAVVEQLIEAANLTQQATVQPSDAWALNSLDSLLRSNESHSRAGALLLAATGLSTPGVRAPLLAEAGQYFARSDDAGRAFQRQASSHSAALFVQATESISSTRIVDAQAEISRSKILSESLPVAVFAAVQSATGLRQLVQSDVAQGVAIDAGDAARRAQLFVVLVSVLSALLMALVISLSVNVGRSVSRPLRRLTAAAATVANLAQDELSRVADEDALVGAVPQLAEIPISSADEIGDLAQAFNRVQNTAAQLLERQVVSRRNVASMFASVGRRTTNLVGRQLSLIDTLERAEDDPETLSTLYRLDHLSTRLRRNANSLVVLSGGSEASGDGRPVFLTDAVRASLGSVEDYKRITIDRLPNVYLSPGVVSDLLLLLAELLENAVLFSPPRTTVTVQAGMDAAAGTCLLSIVDHGMGMPAERLAEENARLERRERLDLAPTNVLGLFVVGRIARRHGLDVTLEPTPEHGITVRVLLPATVLVDVAADAMPARLLTAATRTRPEHATATLGAASAASAAGAWGAAPSREGAPEVTFPAAPASTAPASTAPVPTAPVPTTPVPTPAVTAAPVPAAPVPPEAGQPAAGAPGRPVARRVPGSHWAPEGGGQPPPPPPPSGAAGVRRRVPGANQPPATADPSPGVVPVGSPDPDEARRQITDLERAVAKAAEAGTEPPVPPSLSDLARRAGVRRRVPGVALDEIGGLPTAATTVSSTGVDPESVRSALEDLSSAVDRADHVHHRTSLSAERFAAEAARAAAEADAAARETALREAAGRRDEQRQTVTDLAGQLRARPLELPDVPQTVPDDGLGVAPNGKATTAAPARPARRVPGAALAALNQAGPDVDAAGDVPTGPIHLGRVIDRPERPETVLSWVEDLEQAMAAADPASRQPSDERSSPTDNGRDDRSNHASENGDAP